MFKEFATPKYGWLLFGIVAALLTAAFGGMDAAPPDPAQRGTAPVKAEATPYALEIGPGWVTRIMPGTTHPSKAERFIVVPVSFTNTSREALSWSTLESALRMSGANAFGYVQGRLATEVSPQFFRVLGGNPHRLQPDVPTELLAWWRLPSSEPIPREITLLARGQTWRRDSIQGGMHWADPKLAAEIRVALEDRP